MQLSAEFGQQVIVDNRPGAGSVIGTDIVAKSAPDGLYTGSTIHLAYNQCESAKTAVRSDCGFRADHHGYVRATGADRAGRVKHAYRQGPDCRRQGAPLSYGSAGVQRRPSRGRLFRTTTGINATHVPYKGAAPASIDVAGGQLAFQFASQITIEPLVAGKRVRMLAVTSAKRAASLAEAPSLAESGLAGGRSAGTGSASPRLHARRPPSCPGSTRRSPDRCNYPACARSSRAKARKSSATRRRNSRRFSSATSRAGRKSSKQRRETLAAPRAGTADARN